MKIIKILLFSISFLIFVSCANNQEMFDFSVDVPQTTIRIGERVAFTATLTNLTNEAHTLEHGFSLINIYVRNVDDEPRNNISSVLID